MLIAFDEIPRRQRGGGPILVSPDRTYPAGRTYPEHDDLYEATPLPCRRAADRQHTASARTSLSCHTDDTAMCHWHRRWSGDGNLREPGTASRSPRAPLSALPSAQPRALFQLDEKSAHLSRTDVYRGMVLGFPPHGVTLSDVYLAALPRRVGQPDLPRRTWRRPGSSGDCADPFSLPVPSAPPAGEGAHFRRPPCTRQEPLRQQAWP